MCIRVLSQVCFESRMAMCLWPPGMPSWSMGISRRGPKRHLVLTGVCYHALNSNKTAEIRQRWQQCKILSKEEQSVDTGLPIVKLCSLMLSHRTAQTLEARNPEAFVCPWSCGSCFGCPTRILSMPLGSDSSPNTKSQCRFLQLVINPGETHMWSTATTGDTSLESSC